MYPGTPGLPTARGATITAEDMRDVQQVRKHAAWMLGGLAGWGSAYELSERIVPALIEALHRSGKDHRGKILRVMTPAQAIPIPVCRL